MLPAHRYNNRSFFFGTIVRCRESMMRTFSIEELFREFKQQLGGFAYHFWTKAVPKLNHFSKKGEANALATVHDVNARRRILSNIKANEGFVLFASIAMGVLQLIALDGRNSRSAKKIRYLRTVSRKCPSEATVMYYVRKNIYSLLLQHPDSFITRFPEREADKTRFQTQPYHTHFHVLHRHLSVS